jgi:hypothetical protein
MNKMLAAIAVLLMSGGLSAAVINTNDPGVIAAFATGATVEDFEGISGMTPLALNDYTNATNSSTAVPAGAQLSDDIPGLFFHSGGASFNDPLGNPGTPAALLQLGGGIAGDAHSATNVIGSLEINTTTLDIDNFVEIIFLGGNVNRAGLWLNPSRGNVLVTAFDSTGGSLENVTGTAGNFVGIQRATNDIRFISLVSLSANGFTADDVTYGRTGGGTGGGTVPLPATLLLVLGALGALWMGRRAR